MRIFKTSTILLSTSLFYISSLKAYDFQDGSFYYNILSEEEKKAELVGYQETSIEPEITIPRFIVNESTGDEYEVVSIGDEAFLYSKIESVVFPESIYSIGKSAFKGSENLKSINLPNSVINIGEYAFCNCINATSLSTGGSIQNIGKYAFMNCRLAGDLTFPETLETIEDKAFSGNNISDVYLPSSLNYIGIGVFDYCRSLESINVNPENPFYSSNDGVLYNKDMTAVIMGPGGRKEINIAEGALEIRGLAFFVCWAESVYLPSSLKKIGDYAFGGSSIRSIEIPQNVSYIGRGAFSDCLYIQSVVLPASITELSYASFLWLLSLKSFTSYSLTPPDAEFAFRIGDPDTNTPIEKCDLYVPEESIEAYSEVYPWNRFKNILPIENAGIESIKESEKNQMLKVYDINGINVLNTSEQNALNSLPQGLYIINGKKALIK